MRRSPAAALLGLSLAFGPQAFGAEGPELEALKTAAFRHFSEGRYAEGIQSMEAAYKRSPRPEFLFNIAVGYEKWGGHCAETLRTFRVFFELCGECAARKLAEQRYAAADRQCLAELSGKAAEVTLRTVPAEAVLEVDGNPIALASPAVLRLAPGPHTILALSGALAASHTLVVRGREKMAVELTLTEPRPPPRISVRGAPAGEIHVGDAVFERGAGPEPVEPGPHTIKVLQGAHWITSVDVEVAAGQTLELDLGSPEPSKPLPDVKTASAASQLVARSTPARTAPQSPLPWIGLGAAIAGAFVGATFTVESLGDLDREKTAKAAQVPSAREVNAAQDDAIRHATIANIAFGVAVAGGALALLAWIFGGTPEDPPTAAP